MNSWVFRDIIMSTGKFLSRFCRISLPRSSGSSSQKDPEDKDTPVLRNVNNYNSTWRNITEELNLHQNGSEDLKRLKCKCVRVVTISRRCN